MMTANISTTLKPILIFGLISSGIEIIRKLIFSNLDLQIFIDLDFILFGVVVEFVLLVITGLACFYLTKKIDITKLENSLLRTGIYAILYAFLSMILGQIITIAYGSSVGFQFNLVSSFFHFVPNGITQGILFVLVLSQLTHRDKSSGNKG